MEIYYLLHIQVYMCIYFFVLIFFQTASPSCVVEGDGFGSSAHFAGVRPEYLVELLQMGCVKMWSHHVTPKRRIWPSNSQWLDPQQGINLQKCGWFYPKK